MKRYVKSSAIEAARDYKQEVVMKSDDGLFEVVKENGVGINDTPWEGYKVKSYGDADEYVVEIRLHSGRLPDYNGEPVVIEYKDVEVAHGMRSTRDTFEDTERYIEVLKSALDFAKKIKDSDIISKR